MLPLNEVITPGRSPSLNDCVYPALFITRATGPLVSKMTAVAGQVSAGYKIMLRVDAYLVIETDLVITWGITQAAKCRMEGW